MAVTLTKTAGPSALGPGIKIATYRAAMDSSYPTNGEAIDLTGEFDYVHFATCGAVDTMADAGYKFDIKHPGAGTAITSSNVLIVAHWNKQPNDSTASNIAFPEVDNTTDLSAVGQLQIVVLGK